MSVFFFFLAGGVVVVVSHWLKPQTYDSDSSTIDLWQLPHKCWVKSGQQDVEEEPERTVWLDLGPVNTETQRLKLLHILEYSPHPPLFPPGSSPSQTVSQSGNL